MKGLQRYVFLTDLHWGFERKHGRLAALHDPAAIAIALAFIDDFKPHTIILGGDMLDCAAISHHNDRKPGRIEGLRLLADAEGLRDHVLKPLEAYRHSHKVYIEGNHEDWLHQMVEEHPGLGGVLDLSRLLHLDKWNVIRQGGVFSLGKLTFLHGDQVRGGEHVAKAAVLQYERSVRFGHHHTLQAYTKTSALDIKQPRTGIAIPCLCTRTPGYGKGHANRWVQGFNYGYVLPDGTFSDYVAVIVNRRTVIHGKRYAG